MMEVGWRLGLRRAVRDIVRGSGDLYGIDVLDF